MPTTVTSEDIWSWVYQPLQDLKQNLADNPGTPWAESQTFLLEQLGLSDPADHPFTALLFERLEALSEEERTEVLGSEGLDTLAYEIAQQCASEPEPDSTDSYDESAWQEFLATNLPTWDGSAESWDQFKEWFTYHAIEQGFGTPAGALIAYLDGMPNEDRIAGCAQYGVTIQPASSTAPADDTTATIMADVLAERPDLAEIPEERRRELIAEVLQESAN